MDNVQPEIDAYVKMEQELESKHVGKWVLIHDQSLIALHDSFEAAAEDAVCRFGRGPYLIRQVGAPPMNLPASVIYQTHHA
jgi:hypothetical protein